MSELKKHKQEILSYLKKIALEDNRISISEEKIMKMVEQELDSYETELNQAVEDGIITKSEKVDLYLKRRDIISKAIQIAEDDDNIEADEDALLTALNSKIKELSSLEK